MTLVAVLTIMLVSFGAIAWPFLAPRLRVDARPKGRQPTDDLVSQRDAAYQALKELEFEHNLGNLSDADYHDLRDRYRTQAATILQKLDAETSRPAPEPEPVDRVSAEEPDPACPVCNQAVEDEDAYCWQCGNRLDNRCEECGELLLAEDRFCGGCGRSLEVEA